MGRRFVDQLDDGENLVIIGNGIGREASGDANRRVACLVRRLYQSVVFYSVRSGILQIFTQVVCRNFILGFHGDDILSPAVTSSRLFRHDLPREPGILSNL